MSLSHVRALMAMFCLALLAVPGHAATVPGPELVDRSATRPAWEKDFTTELVRLPPDVEDAAAAAKAEGVPYDRALSRRARDTDPRPSGFTDWWRLPLTLPTEAGDGQVVVEVDEHRVIDGVWLDGQPIGKFEGTWLGQRFSDGQGSLLLPLGKAKAASVLVLRTRTLVSMYPNGFGQLRIRPARLADLLVLERQDGGDGITAVNRGLTPLEIALHIRHEDYFGAPLGAADPAFTIGAGVRRPVTFDLPRDGGLYKTRIWATDARRATTDHWYYHDHNRQVRQRPEVLSLIDGWEYATVAAEPTEFTPPADTWEQVKLPHIPTGEAYCSPWAWYRCSVTVPKEWAGRRLQLHLPRLLYKARIFVDGRDMGQRFNWDLPDEIDLGPVGDPGRTIQIHLAVSDYGVGVADGTTLPDPPAASIPGARRVAPLDRLGLGLDSIPELLGVPVARTAACVVTTRLTGPDTTDLGLALTFANQGDAPLAAELRTTVYRQGVVTLRLPAKPVTIPPGGTTLTVRQEWKGAARWTLETPVLYELRSELLVRGNPVDVLRERFGVREFATAGDRFLLNGAPITLLGGSHVMLSDQVWPLRPHPYRIIRHGVHHPLHSFMVGSHTMDVADETGVLVKAEDGNFGALHQSWHDWSDPRLYARSLSEMTAYWRRHANRPAVMIWDVGNELRYDGHGDEMGGIFRALRTLDPTRLVTVGGPYPQATGATILDFHGWGSWDGRADYWYYRPEERPSYRKKAGIYHRRPADEPASAWHAFSDGELPIDRGSFANPATAPLQDRGGLPALFSEGHYYEDGIVPELTGLDAYRPLPFSPQNRWEFDQSHHFLNWLACRRNSVPSVRLAGFPSSMVHVDRGVGRWIQPLVLLLEDRDLRINAPATLTLNAVAISDLTVPVEAKAKIQLFDGARLVAEMKRDVALAPGTRQRLPLAFAVPTISEDRTLRLHLELWTESRTGWFRDDVLVTAYARPPASTVRTAVRVFDPAGIVAPALADLGLTAQVLAALDGWDPAAGPLLVGPEALTGLDDRVIAGLRTRIQGGGRVVVLGHHVLPPVLSRRLIQRDGESATCTRRDPSPLVAGLLAEDLKAWKTREKDQVVLWDAFDIPTTGNARAHLLSAQDTTPLVELREGSGAVVLCQLNLRDALGLEPAASRVLANLASWLTGPEPFPTLPSLAVAPDPGFTRALRSRFGFAGEITAAPSAADLQRAAVVVVRGDQASGREALTALGPVVKQRLTEGMTLVLVGVDGDAAAWCSDLAEKTITIDHQPVLGAYRTRFDPLLAGTGHGDLWWTTVTAVDPDKPLADPAKAIATHRLSGAGIRPLADPAVVATVPVGKGRLVLTTARILERPLPQATRLLSALLGGAGARLEADGLTEDQWVATPVELAGHGGSSPAIPGLPGGPQRLGGIDWSLPRSGGPLGVGDGQSDAPPLPVGRKVERLAFLHAGLSGRLEFAYKVTYLEDRKAWIPGKPDPFVLVPVRPGNQIQGLADAGKVARGELLLGGASLAWTSPKGDAGLYRQVWDNPSPDKTVEHITVVRTGGSGQVAIAAISTLVRGTAPAAATALPPGISEGNLAARVVFPGYQAFVGHDGTVPVILDGDGKPILALFGWATQDAQHQKDYLAKVREVPATLPGQRIFTIEGTPGSHLAWHGRLEFAPTRIRAEVTYRWVTAGMEPEHTVWGLNRLDDGPFTPQPPNTIPVLLPIGESFAVVQFDRSFLGWYINHRVDEKALVLHLKPKPDVERTAWFDISLP